MHFYSAADLWYGINALQAHKVPICEVYTPDHIHGIENKLRIKDMQLGYGFLKYGCLGGAALTSLVYYIFGSASSTGSTEKPLLMILLNVVVMLMALIFAVWLFALKVPKICVFKRNHHQYLIVVDANSITYNEEIINLLKYAEAVEISDTIKKMITP